jgi:hypothetical protein
VRRDPSPSETWSEKYGQFRAHKQPFRLLVPPISDASKRSEVTSPAFDIALLGMPFDTAVTYRLGALLAKSFHRTFLEGFIPQLQQQLELVHEDLHRGFQMYPRLLIGSTGQRGLAHLPLDCPDLTVLNSQSKAFFGASHESSASTVTPDNRTPLRCAVAMAGTVAFRQLAQSFSTVGGVRLFASSLFLLHIPHGPIQLSIHSFYHPYWKVGSSKN